MIRKYWKTLLVATLICLLPIIAGVILWNQLPDPMPSHWNAAGEVDGWSSKPFAVFGLPLIMVFVLWLCAWGTGADPKKANHSDKIVHVVLWIIPVISVVMHTVTYAVALGNNISVGMTVSVLLGLMFVIIGNYLPKCKQNYTIGIKIPWTLNSEENWNRTHRLAGHLWSVCGIVIILSGFAGGVWICLSAALVMVFVPMIYSYMLHRKGI